jgi:phytoene synthase
MSPVRSPAHAHAQTAAGITDPELRRCYEIARELTAEHGKTYYLATWLLPPDRRPHVWALYAFARWADEFVDSMTHPDPEGLLAWSATAMRDLAIGRSIDPIINAAAHTVHELGIELSLFEDFLASMRMDIDIDGYATYADLQVYTRGSAMVIGLMMLPVLGPLSPDASRPAEALGEAFQMSNFIRDVGEDLERGRVYLPQEDLDAFGVTREDLRVGVVTDAIRALLRFEIARTRELYALARPGITLVEPTSRPCLRTAIELYGGILDEVERADYQVLRGRVSVPNTRRAGVALPAYLKAIGARRERARWQRA